MCHFLKVTSPQSFSSRELTSSHSITRLWALMLAEISPYLIQFRLFLISHSWLVGQYDLEASNLMDDVISPYLLGVIILPSLCEGCWVLAQHFRAVPNIPLGQFGLKPRAMRWLAVLMAEDISILPEQKMPCRPHGWFTAVPRTRSSWTFCVYVSLTCSILSVLSFGNPPTNQFRAFIRLIVISTGSLYSNNRSGLTYQIPSYLESSPQFLYSQTRTPYSRQNPACSEQ
ncbi:hypothetical protein V8F20_004631 [Naviculisporaceae sp. PSN 640]